MGMSIELCVFPDNRRSRPDRGRPGRRNAVAHPDQRDRELEGPRDRQRPSRRCASRRRSPVPAGTCCSPHPRSRSSPRRCGSGRPTPGRRSGPSPSAQTRRSVPGTVTARRRMTCRYRRRPMPGGLQRRPRRMRPMVDGRLQHIPVHGRDPAGAGRWHAGVQHLRLRRGPPHDGIRPQGCSCLRRQWIGRRARDLHPASVVSGQSARCSCPLGGREPGCRAGGQPPITVRMPGGGPGRGSSRRARDRARGCAG